MDPDLEVQEALARIAKMRAEEAKALAEADKARSEQRPWAAWRHPNAWILVLGVLGAFGTATIQCQRSVVAADKAEVALDRATLDLDKKNAQITVADEQLAQLKRKIEEATSTLQDMQSQLDKIDDSDAKARLDTALDAIREILKRISVAIPVSAVDGAAIELPGGSYVLSVDTSGMWSYSSTGRHQTTLAGDATAAQPSGLLLPHARLGQLLMRQGDAPWRPMESATRVQIADSGERVAFRMNDSNYADNSGYQIVRIVQDPTTLISIINSARDLFSRSADTVALAESIARAARGSVWPSWSATYGDGTVVNNKFRFYRDADEVLRYFTGRATSDDCDAWYLDASGTRKPFCSKDAREFAGAHGGIIDVRIME